jgi:hypothetical protein
LARSVPRHDRSDDRVARNDKPRAAVPSPNLPDAAAPISHRERLLIQNIKMRGETATHSSYVDTLVRGSSIATRRFSSPVNWRIVWVTVSASILGGITHSAHPASLRSSLKRMDCSPGPISTTSSRAPSALTKTWIWWAAALMEYASLNSGFLPSAHCPRHAWLILYYRLTACQFCLLAGRSAPAVTCAVTRANEPETFARPVAACIRRCRGRSPARRLPEPSLTATKAWLHVTFRKRLAGDATLSVPPIQLT